MRKRTEKSQKLINEGKIWKDELTNKWSRICPQCFKIIHHTCYNTCFYSIDKRCDNCSRPNRPHKKSNFVENLISNKLIWKDDSNFWYRKCPNCSSTLRHNSINSCIQLYKSNSKCLRCSHPCGKNSNNYGKHHSKETKEKLSKMFKGKRSHPLSDEHKKKISEGMRKNPKRIILHNGNNQYKRKLYKFPNGKEVWIQGYEPWTLNLLLNEGFKSEEIGVGKKERPIINYNWSESVFKYLPDCYLSNSNTVVETKSEWTWNNNLEQNISKLSGSLKSGFDVRMIIWKPGKILLSDKTYTTLDIS